MRVASKSLVLIAAIFIFSYAFYTLSTTHQVSTLTSPILDTQIEGTTGTGRKDASTITNASPIPTMPSSHLRTESQGFIRSTTSPQVCIVSRTYEKQYSYLLTHLLSISHNPVAMPRVLFVITDENSKPEPVIESIRAANSLTGYDMAHLLPITPQLAQNISADYKTDFGYSYTDAAIEYLLQHSNEYPCDYLIFTNGDNFYSTTFLDDYILPDIAEGVQIIGFNFVTRYKYGGGGSYSGEIRDDTSRLARNAFFKIGDIDLGAFVLSIKLLSEDPDMRFIRQNTLSKSTANIASADGKFVEYVASKGYSSRIHRQTLLVHQ